ncbi:MAG: hypothetical protein GC204_05720 [Chloroflexi bacterium]|nr:hypothetical protein [Chloroflexota bacterium]
MRMNRGTIILLAALLVVIVAVLVINNNQASAPGVTPTAAEASGPLLPGVTADKIVRYEVRDNKSGYFTALTKDSGGGWHIDGTNTLPARDPDQSLITSTAGQIVTINYNNTFQDDQLATFGLDAPAYTVLALTSDGKLYTLYIGAKAPTSSRYYAVLVTGVSEATPEVTTESGAAPQAIATSNVESQAENGGNIAPEGANATAEATAETTDVAKKIFQGLQEARAQATAEVTAEATAEATTEMMAASTMEASSPVMASTAEATAAATAEATAEATANVIQAPGVTLSGSQTIYVIPQTVIDTLTKWINTPPYAPLPTATPTLPVIATLPVIPTQEVTPEATALPTQEVTPEATAAS